MEHNRIALIASLDTKLQETLYAKHEIESCGGQGLIIDISTKTLVDADDAVGPADILARYGMTWEEFGPLDKAQSIETMSNSLTAVMPALYAEGLFDASFHQGRTEICGWLPQYEKSCHLAYLKLWPLPWPAAEEPWNNMWETRISWSSTRLQTFPGLIIPQNCDSQCLSRCPGHAPTQRQVTPDSRKKIAATMLGITSKGVEGALRLLPDGT